LYEGADSNKDQTYFLWKVPARHLAYSLFPVGTYEKPYVRELAEKYELPVASKKDSQGVCFLGQLDMKEFLSHYIDTRAGDVLNTAGDVIGYHDGAIFYTYGQRHGFTVTDHGANDAPRYIIGKDIERNTITVAQKTESDSRVHVTHVSLTNTNWITRPMTDGSYQVRFRYRQPKQKAALTVDSDTTATVSFHDDQYNVVPGQSMVIYDGTQCLGGGIIDTVN